MADIQHITPEAEKNAMPTPSTFWSKLTGAIGATGILFSIAGYVYVAGGLGQKVATNEMEIKTLRQSQATQVDVQRIEKTMERIEGKLDQFILQDRPRESNRQRQR